QQGLTHSHEHNVCQWPSVKRFCLVANGDNLIVNLVRSQVALPLEAGGSTEFARQAATHLRRYTCSNPLFSWNQHRFNNKTVVKSDRILDRTVRAALHVIDLD